MTRTRALNPIVHRAGDLMQDFKTGHLVGASPRAQFQGQLIGSLVSVFVTTTAFAFYSQAYTIPGPNFPVPTAYVWLNFARLLRSSSLPPHVDKFMAAFGAAAGCFTLTKLWAMKNRTAWVRWIPSGVAFAIGMLNTPNFSMTRLVGGVAELAWRRRVIARKRRPLPESDEDEDDEARGRAAPLARRRSWEYCKLGFAYFGRRAGKLLGVRPGRMWDMSIDINRDVLSERTPHNGDIAIGIPVL